MTQWLDPPHSPAEGEELALRNGDRGIVIRWTDPADEGSGMVEFAMQDVSTLLALELLASVIATTVEDAPEEVKYAALGLLLRAIGGGEEDAA